MLRRLLDLLDRDALVGLQDIRGLRGKMSNDERRTGLSRSYRGDLDSFLADLRREDLLTIFSRDFLVRGRRYSTGGLSSFGRDDLQKMARRLFIRGDVPMEFVELEENAFVIGDVDADQPSDQVSPEGDGDEELLEDALETDGGPTLAGPEWGRARKITVLLRALGMEVPERLRTVRFRELLQRLAALGIEAQLQDGTPVTDSDESPGIYEKLRLRKRVVSQVAVSAAPTVEVPKSAIETFSVELNCWPSAVAGAKARVECVIEDGPQGLRIDNSVPGVSAVCRETYEVVLQFLSDEERDRLASATVTLRLHNFPPVIEEVHPSLSVALALIGVARRRRPLPGLVISGVLSLAGDVLSLFDPTVLQALAAEDKTLVVPSASLGTVDFSGMSGEMELLPVSRLADAAQLTFVSSTPL
jgi:hypothetical protein